MRYQTIQKKASSVAVCILVSLALFFTSLYSCSVNAAVVETTKKVTLGATETLDNLTPYWTSTTMYNESVMMVTDGTSAPSATLAFQPIRILSVKSYSLNVTYREGVDWRYEGGKLILLPGSSAPYMTNAQLYPTNPKPGEYKDKIGGGYVYFVNSGSAIVAKQLVVTYTHAANAWKGPVPTYAENLPKTTYKLQNAQPFRLGLYGDSISVGGTCSQGLNYPPYMPTWGWLVSGKLADVYGSTVSFINPSLGGMTSTWGAQNALYRVAPQKPDLLIIAFGMNDTCTPEEYGKNVQQIMADVRAYNPDCEFLLVAPIVANPETKYSHGQDKYLSVLQTMEGPGVVVANMTGVHEELLKTKKYIDMTANNLNHPNDFLIRWYAQYIIGMLINNNSPSKLCNVLGVAEPADSTLDIKTKLITANVSQETDKLTLSLVLNEGATWKLYRNLSCTLPVQPEGSAPLAIGTNIFYLRITASDGVTYKDYELLVNRGKKSPPPKVYLDKISPSRFNVNGANLLYIKGTVYTHPGLNATVSAVIKNAQGKIAAKLNLPDQMGGSVDFYWDGRATMENTMGLPGGALVPASLLGTNYSVCLMASDVFGQKTVSQYMSFVAYMKS